MSVVVRRFECMKGRMDRAIATDCLNTYESLSPWQQEYVQNFVNVAYPLMDACGNGYIQRLTEEGFNILMEMHHFMMEQIRDEEYCYNQVTSMQKRLAL